MDPSLLHLPSLIDVVNSPIKVINCSCGIKCGSREMYFHHLECTLSNDKHLPKDASLWPLRFFRTIPNISLSQRGCIARNAEYNYVHYIVIWLNRMQNQQINSLSFNNQLFIQNSIPKIKKFITSIPSQSTFNNNNNNNNSVTMIALGNDLWNILINTNNNLSKPQELKQFTSKYSYINKNQEILPIYKQNYTFNDNDKNKDSIHYKTQADIFIMIKSDKSSEECVKIGTKCVNLLDNNIISYIERVNSFKYKNGKDLTGFIDGTKNNDYNLRDLSCTVLINENRNKCGSYVYCSRFIHNLKKFKSLDIDHKSSIIGRQYGCEMQSKSIDGRIENPRIKTDVDLNGHVFRAWGEMYRQSYPYYRSRGINPDHDQDDDDIKDNDMDNNIDHEECGLFFCSFSHSLNEIDTSLERMIGKWSNGLDNLFKITESIFNGYFYAPSLKELKILSNDLNNNNQLTKLMKVNYNVIENKCIIPDDNYCADTFIEEYCNICKDNRTVLTDNQSDIFFCFECRNVQAKSNNSNL